MTKPPQTGGTSTWIILEGKWGRHMKGSGEDIILEGPDNVTLEQALKLNFKASNNQAEYKTLIACLKLAKKVGAKKLRCYTDSQLV